MMESGGEDGGCLQDDGDLPAARSEQPNIISGRAPRDNPAHRGSKIEGGAGRMGGGNRPDLDSVSQYSSDTKEQA